MLVIFRQTYKKLLFSASTVIILGISYLIFKSMLDAYNVADNYFISAMIESTLMAVVYPYGQMFMWFFFPVYVAINSGKFISEEIENGTFLTNLSKPLTRAQILIEKFLALICVNMSMCLAILGYVWYTFLSNANSEVMFRVMNASIGTFLFTSFVVQLILSIFLVILSLKFNSKIILGLGMGIGLLAQLWPGMGTSFIVKNQAYQRTGTVVRDKETVDSVESGQNLYKKFIRPILIVDHMNQLFYEGVAKAYEPFGMSEEAKSVSYAYNREAIIKKTTKEETNLLGKKVEKVTYKVVELKPWIDNDVLKRNYTIISVLIALFGFMYFQKKDIT